MGAKIEVTKEWLEGFLKEQLGEARSEFRREMEAKANELMRTSGGVPALIARGFENVSKSRDGIKKPGALMARLLTSIVAGNGNGHAGAAFAEKRYGKDEAMEPVLKTLLAGDFTGAGAVIDTTVSADFIEALGAATVCRRLGAYIEPLPTGSALLRKETSSPTARFVGENQSGRASQPAHGWLALTAKPCVALVPISNKAIRWAANGGNPVNLEQRVQTSAIKQVRRREDQAFIRDMGTEYTPKGLRYLTPDANIETMTATPTNLTAVIDLGKLLGNLRNSDVAMEKPGWMFAPRVQTWLETLQTSDGHYAFRTEMVAGTLWGFPFGSTSAIPTNLGGGTESEVYLTDFDEFVIGDEGNINVTLSKEGSYTDSDGNTQSAFENNETVVRVELNVDCGLKHDLACSILTGVTWGA